MSIAGRRTLGSMLPLMLLLWIVVVPNHASASTPSVATPRGSGYVALGDSYSAGEGLLGYEQLVDGSDNPCHRSSAGYPAYAFRNSLFASKATSIRFVACSGSTTRDLFAANHANPDEKPQLDAVDDRTGLVTMTIGGNDLGFASVLADCVYAQEGYTGLITVKGSPGCSKRQAVSVKERQDRFAGLSVDTSSENRSLAEVLSAIRSHGPKAEVYVAGYPRFFGSAFVREGVLRTACQVGAAYRNDGAFEARLFVEESDARWLNKQVDALNKTVRDQVNQVPGMHYVDPNVAAGFKTHGLCDSADAYLDTVHVDESGAADPGTFHPTLAGQRAYAEVFRRAVGSTFPPQIELPVMRWTLSPGEQIEEQLRILDKRKGTWTVSAGDLPTGVTLTPTGLLQGPVAVAGSWIFTVRFTDAAGLFDDVQIVVDASSQTEPPPLATFTSSTGVFYPVGLSCRSATRCVTIGWGDYDRHTYSRLTPQGWTSPVTSRTAGLFSDYTVQQDGLACTTGGRCYAALSDDGLWTTADDGGRWSRLTTVATSAVRCDVPTLCVTVADESSSGRPAVESVTPAGLSPIAPLPSQHLSHVSCTSTNACVATSYDGELLSWDGRTWSVSTQAVSQWEALACATSTFCVAGNRAGEYSLWNGVAWSPRTRLAVPSYIGSADCTASRCYLTTQDRVYRVQANASLRDLALPVLATAIPGENDVPFTISCPNDSVCRVSTTDGDVFAWDGSSWTMDPARYSMRFPVRTGGEGGDRDRLLDQGRR